MSIFHLPHVAADSVSHPSSRCFSPRRNRMKPLPSLITAIFTLTLTQLSQSAFAQSTTYLSNFNNPAANGLFTGANRFVAQSFVTGNDPRGYSLDFVKILVGIDGTPPGNFQVFLYSDNASEPGSSLGQ